MSLGFWCTVGGLYTVAQPHWTVVVPTHVIKILESKTFFFKITGFSCTIHEQVAVTGGVGSHDASGHQH